MERRPALHRLAAGLPTRLRIPVGGALTLLAMSEVAAAILRRLDRHRLISS